MRYKPKDWIRQIEVTHTSAYQMRNSPRFTGRRRGEDREDVGGQGERTEGIKGIDYARPPLASSARRRGEEPPKHRRHTTERPEGPTPGPSGREAPPDPRGPIPRREGPEEKEAGPVYTQDASAVLHHIVPSQAPSLKGPYKTTCSLREVPH